MTDDEIRLAIAESIGWQWWRFETAHKSIKFYQLVEPKNSGWPIRQGGKRCDRPKKIEDISNLPQYPQDLNAIHKVIQGMRPDDASKWSSILVGLISFGANPHWPINFHIAQATARERCEAYLKTLGKWKD